ncbi:MAG: SusD/RagB family nutrient-binding outer membrane lipoprotein [Saprospiraceae bacterium]|nr:SusD/RagB family nutrient-binding outer membrane lipoprotein [Saprospiraceae bacterium]
MKKLSLYFLAGALLFFSGCGKFVDGFETSPNSPENATPALLLTYTQVAVYNAYTGQLARMASVLTQQSAGAESQFQEIAEYNILSGDNVNEWESLYSACMNNAQTLMSEAGNENPHYRGMARILKAMSLGLATDYWGDVPNSEALQGLQGETAFSPAFDSQESILNDIQATLDSAIIDLSTSADANVLIPSSDDLSFGGDVNAWIVTAHILKARYYNRLSKRDASGSATSALASIDAATAAGLGTTADMNAVFGTAVNELNQWYAFQQDRAGYMQMGDFFISMLDTKNDPRLSYYADTSATGTYVGTPLGSTDNTTSPINTSTGIAATGSSLPLVTYAEAKFIEAEAALRAGDNTRAATAYNDAVITHITQSTGTAPDATYVTNHASETDATITLERIMEQKYIAMFTQPEVWSDWRRTNFPTLTADPRATIDIPRRLLTPQSELDYNSNAPTAYTVQANLVIPVWWDE